MAFSWIGFAIQVYALAPMELINPFSPQALVREVVEFTPRSGHHFSMEAPQNCGTGAVVERGARRVRCQFGGPGRATVGLNVCDDRKTFCKPVSLELTITGQGAARVDRLEANQGRNRDLAKTLLPGFEHGRPDAIRTLASQEKRAVFVMVSTDWCPACNEAKEYLIPTDGFREASQEWIRVYVDGDSVGASEWEPIVRFRYFPSFVLLNSDLQEVARYTGPLRQADFVAWATAASRDLADPIPELRKRVLARRGGLIGRRVSDLLRGVSAANVHADESRLLKWALDQDDEELVFRMTSDRKFPDLEAELIRFQIGKTPKEDRDKKVELYQRLLGMLIKLDGWAVALEEFCEFDAKACAPQRVHIESRLAVLKTRPGLSEAERASLLGEEYAYLASVHKELGKKADETAYAKACVESYDRLRAFGGLLKVPRSAQQGMVSCLESAGQTARAASVLRELIGAYPNEPTFLVRMARMDRRAHRFAAALAWLDQAEKVAYGYNWFNAQILRAETLMDLNRAGDARTVIERALEQLRLGPASDSRDQRLASRLRSVQISLDRASVR